MDTGYLEVIGGRYFCRFSNGNCWPEINVVTPIICCSFQTSQRYEIDDYANCIVLNSNPRKISICDLELGDLVKPHFFELVSSIVSPFYIRLARDEIQLIEQARGEGDVRIL